MYTIGTSSIKYIASEISDPIIKAALDGKIVGFVGTEGDREGDGTALHPKTLISPYSVFFEVPSQTQPVIDLYHIQWPITTAQLWRPNDHYPMPNGWLSVGAPLDPTFVADTLLPAGGLKDALYAFARGYEGDISTIPMIDGLPFYSRDTQSLFIYDRFAAQWVKLASAATVPIGSMIGWPEALDVYRPLPYGYVRADGTLRLKAGAFAQLFAIIRDSFEDPLSPSPIDQFRLPKYSAMLVRYIP
jgi:hypothetical protein